VLAVWGARYAGVAVGCLRGPGRLPQGSGVAWVARFPALRPPGPGDTSDVSDRTRATNGNPCQEGLLWLGWQLDVGRLM
jgi:hypothetical protein